MTQDCAKGTVTMSQECYLMACLEKFSLVRSMQTAVALINLFLLDQPLKIILGRRLPIQLLKSFIAEWSAVSCILLRTRPKIAFVGSYH
jgi:hypothetical protein